MITRKKVGIIIDYTIRIPAFIDSYETFRAFLFNIFEDDDKMVLGPDNYWFNVMKDDNVAEFYAKKAAPANDYDLVNSDLKEYFYCEEDFNRFINEYSYNMYANSPAHNRKDIEVINVAQKALFDIVLIDRVMTKRKVGNTFFFLSANHIYPQSLMFLFPGQEMNKESYFAIWDPANNPEQRVTKEDELMNWFMELEKTLKKDE